MLKYLLVLAVAIVGLCVQAEKVEAGPLLRGIRAGARAFHNREHRPLANVAKAFRNREHRPIINAVKAVRNRERRPLMNGTKAVGRFVARRAAGNRFRGHCTSGGCSGGSCPAY